MSLRNAVKIFNIRTVLLIISLAEMLFGIFADAYSFTSVGIVSALYICEFSASRKTKGKFSEILVYIFAFATILTVGFFSVSEVFMSVGFYENQARLWIFPVIVVLFFVRMILKIRFEDKFDFIFPAFLIFLYVSDILCILFGYYAELLLKSEAVFFYVEPAFSVAVCAYSGWLLWGKLKKRRRE